jgi:DNA polymerase III epsilon subunit-like protein
MTDVMIDIETLSTSPNALILTIGAIKFNRKGVLKKIDDLDTFYVRINQDSCKSLGMDVNNDTVSWWLSQSDDAKYEVFENKDRMNIKEGLLKLYDFIKPTRYVWANSPNFDCVILENAFKLCDIEVPWKFWNLRDCRTVYDLGNTRLSGTTSHNALEDCYNQIICLKKCLDTFRHL